MAPVGILHPLAWLCASATGAIFALIKLCPPANAVACRFWGPIVLDPVKLAQNLNTGRTVSLNSTASRNGPARVRDLKLGWQEGIEKEFRERLGLGIEQKTSRSPVGLVMPDGERLEPLNRDSRRVIEKELCPTYKETTSEGHEVVRHLR